MANNIDRANHGTHSIVNYSLFVGIWWLLTLLYFLPTSFLDKFSIPIVDVAMDALSVLFSFCAAVALAAYLGAHSCSNYVRLLPSYLFKNAQKLIVNRLTLPQTKSATALPTHSKTVVKHRLHAPSCGSAGPLSSPLSSST
jgi:cellulose synthase/poly-beta-1,6-N-acetylglucosamine synthase-like glycosyltransferase